jgi:hypothetical protein
MASYYLRETAIHSFVLGFDDTNSGGGMQERVRAQIAWAVLQRAQHAVPLRRGRSAGFPFGGVPINPNPLRSTHCTF